MQVAGALAILAAFAGAKVGGGSIPVGATPANLAPCAVAMSEISDNARLVLDSLETKPALNTPALIAQNEGMEREDAEIALAELKEAGLVRATAMGWKLPRR